MSGQPKRKTNSKKSTKSPSLYTQTTSTKSNKDNGIAIIIGCIIVVFIIGVTVTVNSLIKTGEKIVDNAERIAESSFSESSTNNAVNSDKTPNTNSETKDKSETQSETQSEAQPETQSEASQNLQLYKEAMNGYLDFLEEYVDFMNKYKNASSTEALSMMKDYTDILARQTEWLEKTNELEKNFKNNVDYNSADYKEYLKIHTEFLERSTALMSQLQ